MLVMSHLLLSSLALGVQCSPRQRFQASSSEIVEYSGYLCGDNRCWCYEECADCSGQYGIHTYVPRLPENISHLDFSGNKLNSLMLTQDFFTNATRISYLELAHNELTDIPQGVLHPLRNLTSISVDHNINLTINGIRSLVSISSLQDLSANNCTLSSLPPDVFIDAHSHIRWLYLAKNKMLTLNLTLFLPLTQLFIVDLSGNEIRRFTSGSIVKMKILNLYRNPLREIPKTCQNGVSLFPELEVLSLKRTDISSIQGELCLPSLQRLDLSYNLIVEIPSATFRNDRFPRLSSLLLKYCILFTLRENAFQNSELSTLSLIKNNLNFGLKERIHSKAFANCPKLMKLILDGNNFMDVDDDRFQQLFGHLPLTYLSIRQSGISAISSAMFAGLTRLVTLDLRGNKIATVPAGAFDLCLKLRTLDLSQNRISVVTENTFNAGTRNRLYKLNLGNNPFTCSCALLWFKSWLTSNTTPVDRFLNRYDCNNIPGTRVEDFTMARQACLLSRETSIRVVVTCTVLILTLTVFCLVFHYRWHVRLALYEAFRARDEVRRLRFLANNFDYDVFVSYDSEDEPWVREHLMAELEGRLGLRVCVHERDFIPGKNILDNIADCVQSSKKILMVFSRDFVRSQWCQFELTFCLRHAMDHDDSLIIVCVDDVASRDMTTAMMAVMKTTTYIQWAEFRDAVDSFWARLRLALREVIEQVDP